MKKIAKIDIYTRLTINIIPIIIFIYIFAQITRFNVSFAKHQFLSEIGMGEAEFGLAVSSFYVGYLVFQVPAGFLLGRLGFPRFLLCITTAWGLTGCLMAFVRDAGDLYVLRLVLGAAQAGFFPGIIIFLSAWYPAAARGRINAMFTVAIPLGGIIAGPLAAWIMGGLDGAGGLRGWQWLFLIEGLPVIAAGLIAFFALADGPESARWLDAAGRARLLAEREGVPRAPAWSRLPALVRDPRLWLLGLIYFGYFCALNAFIVWTPSLLRIAGLDDIESIGWVSGFIALVSCAGMLMIGISSDRTGDRRWHVASCGLAAAASYLMIGLPAGVAPTIAALALAGTALFAMLGLFWTIPSPYLGMQAGPGHVAFINTLGVCGGIVSPTLVGGVAAATGDLHQAIGLIGLVLAAAMGLLLLFVRIPQRRTA